MILFFRRETYLLMLDFMIETGGDKSTYIHKYDILYQLYFQNRIWNFK